MRSVLARVRAGEEDPHCLRCGGLVKSATISFGQPLRPTSGAPPWPLPRIATSCSVVGTSLQVQPVASLCDHALSAGARLVVVNAEPTPYDTHADAVLRHPISMVLPALVGRTAA